MNPRLFKGTIVAIFLFSLAFSVYYFLVEINSMKFDEVTYASFIQDGDTFETSAGDWIRLADVDTPESWQSGYGQASDVLSQLIHNKKVYMDVDDISVTDPYGRYVCVVYVDFNSTHYLNVNHALLLYGVADIDDYYNNEFSPYEWTLFVSKLSYSDRMKFLGFSVGFSFITTLILYVITMKIWSAITTFVRERGKKHTR